MAPSAPGSAPGADHAPISDSYSPSSYSANAPSNGDTADSLTKAQSKTHAQLRQPVRRSSSIQDILETGRRRSEILSASNSNSHTNLHGLNQHQANSPQPLRRNSTIKITPEQAEHLREHEEFLEWKRQKAQREAQRQREEGMDSVDERSAIRSQGDGGGYGTSRDDSKLRSGDSRSRPSQRSQQSKKAVGASSNDNDDDDDDARENANQTGQIHINTPPHRDGFWKRAFKQFGSLELENKGSVARDHLALERTFLAWLRTSLAFASIGIAVTQLFRLNTTLARDDPANHDGNPETGTHLHLRALGKPIGATFIAISIVVLFTGYHRYFESQHWIIKGKFPASRGSIALISLIALLLMVASFVLIMVVEPRTFEK